MRGSRTAYRRSTSALKKTMKNAPNNVTPMIGGRSKFPIDNAAYWPTPCRSKTVSVRIAPPPRTPAKSGGLSDVRIIFRHLLPNVVTQAIVFAMSDIVLDILAIVTLGYLGLGVQPPTPDWGRMIADGQTYLTTHWELSTIPGIAVVITALGLSLLADGLADVLRPE